MKRKFREVRLSKANRERLEIINRIVQEYQGQGLKLTLRQLYYQLVSRDIIPNKKSEYSKLSTLLKEGRMGGVVDWDAIEDRLRVPKKPSSWNSPAEILDSAIYSFALPRQEGQDVYLEVWVEKDALSGVLSRVTSKYHIPILVNRGYSSASAMYEAYNRFQDADVCGQAVKILYLGDYDPSGIDMIRDIRERTLEFFGPGSGVDFEVVPIALTRKQIEQYDPPPNPAKMLDPRAGSFLQEHGTTSWEVDALRPEVLNQILTEKILQYIDEERYTEIVGREEGYKNQLRAMKTTFADQSDNNEEAQ